MLSTGEEIVCEVLEDHEIANVPEFEGKVVASFPYWLKYDYIPGQEVRTEMFEFVPHKEDDMVALNPNHIISRAIPSSNLCKVYIGVLMELQKDRDSKPVSLTTNWKRMEEIGMLPSEGKLILENLKTKKD